MLVKVAIQCAIFQANPSISQFLSQTEGKTQ
jgi:hypothetical protein